MPYGRLIQLALMLFVWGVIVWGFVVLRGPVMEVWRELVKAVRGGSDDDNRT